MRQTRTCVHFLALFVLALAPATAHAWPILEWVNTTPDTGSARTMEYDADRHVVVMRIEASDASKQTWEWAGAEWSRVADAPMFSPMVWSPDRHALLGLDYSAVPPRLWQYDGATWSVVSTTAPSARGSFRQAYNSTNHRLIVLFDAVPPGPAFTSETWTWDGSTWTLASNAGPSQIQVPMFTFDTIRGVAVLLDGLYNPGLTQTWEWNGSAWSQATPAHSPTVGGPGAFDSTRGVTVVLEAFNGPYPDHHIQAWEWNGSDWSLGPAGPGEMLRPNMAWFDPIRSGVVTFDTVYSNEYSPGSEPGRLWKYDGAAWGPILHGAPKGRAECGLVYDSVRHCVLLGPGEPGGGLQFDAWEFDGAIWVLKNNQLPELGRRLYAMAFDRSRGVAVINGGYGAAVDTIEWSGGAWTQRLEAGPAHRVYHSMVYDSSRSVCMLFGGWDGSNSPTAIKNDTWEWDGIQWIQRAIAGPSTRYGHVMAYDADRHVTVLFGGLTRTMPGPVHQINDTWEYDGTAWTMKSPATSPQARYVAAMAFDPDRHVVVLHGGASTSNGVLDDLWEWDGVQWRQTPVSTPKPSHRDRHAMAYDEVRHEMVLGSGRFGYGDTWRLCARPCPADLDGDGAVGSPDLAQLLGSWGVNSPADQNGDGIVSAADLALLLGAWGPCP